MAHYHRVILTRSSVDVLPPDGVGAPIWVSFCETRLIGSDSDGILRTVQVSIVFYLGDSVLTALSVSGLAGIVTPAIIVFGPDCSETPESGCIQLPVISFLFCFLVLTLPSLNLCRLLFERDCNTFCTLITFINLLDHCFPEFFLFGYFIFCQIMLQFFW